MSSYFPSFSYLNQNSQNDFGLVVASIDPDNGEMDSGMSQEQIYTDSFRGTKRLLYGTRYDSTPTIKITVVKCTGDEFKVDECRLIYKWLIGNPNASWMDMYVGDELWYSFLGTIQDVRPYKMDARTVAFNIYFESISPWAYSAMQHVSHSLNQTISIDDDGEVILAKYTVYFKNPDNADINALQAQLMQTPKETGEEIIIQREGPISKEEIMEVLKKQFFQYKLVI